MQGMLNALVTFEEGRTQAPVQKMDPQMRKLLEVSWEAWVDSGIDVSKLRGSNRVGVYIGCCGSEVHFHLLLHMHEAASPSHHGKCLTSASVDLK